MQWARGSTSRLRSILALVVIAALALGLSVTSATAISGSSISGTIRDTAGNPLEGVNVQLFTNLGSPKWGSSDVTDVNGAYSIGGLSAGAYKVGFQKNGYASQYWEKKARLDDADGILVDGVTALSSYDATISRAGGIAGTIVPGPGVTVPLDGQIQIYEADSHGGYLTYATVDSSDPDYPAFEFPPLEPGSYIIKAVFDDDALIDEWYAGADTFGKATVIEVAAESTTAVTVTARLGGTIRGRVTNETTGLPAASVEVDSVTTGDYWFADPDVDGNYEVKGLPPGTYRVNAEADDSAYVWEYYRDTQNEWDAETISITGTEVVSSIDLQLLKGSSVEGTITGSNGVPLPLVWARLDGETADGAWLTKATRTSQDGTYRIKGVPSGTYRLYFDTDELNRSNISTLAPTGVAGEYWDDAAVYANATELVFAEPTATKNVDASLAAAGSIKGTVRNAEGKPLTGVAVRAMLEDGAADYYTVCTNYTNPDGSYELRGLPAGRYVVKFGVDGPSDAALGSYYPNGADTQELATKLQLGSGQTLTGIDGVPTTEYGRLWGRVLGADGKPAAGVRVVLSRETADGGYVESPGDYRFTDEEGGFNIQAVGKMKIRFIDDMKRYVDASGPAVEIQPGRNVEVTQTLQFVQADSPAGADRFATSVEISKRAFARGAFTVIVATGRNWPDALGGAGLSGAVGRAPILLVEKDSIPEVVAHELARLDNKGWIRRVYILGGPTVVSQRVEQQLREMFDFANEEPGVIRLSGGTRYETAERIAGEIIGEMGREYDGTALVATGLNYPDAIAASPLAAAKGWPLYLVPGTGVSAAMADAMAAKGVKKVVLLGGTSALPVSTVETPLKAKFGADNVERLAGGTRYATAIEIGKFGVLQGLSWNGVGFATGTNFPDALSGGILQAVNGSVLLLTPGTSLDPGAEALIKQKKSEILSVRFYGGTGAISQAVRDKVAAARR